MRVRNVPGLLILHTSPWWNAQVWTYVLSLDVFIAGMDQGVP